MERIIQPYGSAIPGGLTRPTPNGPPGLAPALAAAHAPKTVSDFARALRRRAWLVLAVALVVSLSGTALILRQPPVYQAMAEIQVVPPEFDPALAVIVGGAANISRDNADQYVLDRIAELKSKRLVDRVVLELGPAAGADPLADVQNGLTTRRIPGTNWFHVFLESRDREHVARLLNALIEELDKLARDRNSSSINEVQNKASDSLRQLAASLKKLDDSINERLQAGPHFSPDGRFVLEEEQQALKSLLLQKKVRFDDLVHEQRMSEMWPSLRQPVAPTSAELEVAKLTAQLEDLDYRLEDLKRSFRGKSYLTDPYFKSYSRYRAQLVSQIERLRSRQTQPPEPPDLRAYSLSRAAKEIREIEGVVDAQQAKLQQVMPDYQQFLGLLKQREQLESMIASTERQLTQFRMVAVTQKKPIEVSQPAADPMAPIRPNRPIGITIVSMVGLILGIALVCLLESLDHSVKVPEQLTVGLTLPLFGVVPRMRRLAPLEKGGHLWTPGVPRSLEADAFRNVRASLIGAERPDEPIVTLLVTSAKAGEGKSTTALNLAATCARAGERTILVDCDLRRPSLAEVFDADPSIGVVDVLQGLLPWQRAVARTEIANLSFLPAGDVAGVPIEILGSLELRQLIAALAGHYHRVILDGPAVLGLADCRMLGQVVDATLLVVRSGAHELRPLRRAKEMLEQSRVRIAGVVFNGLSEDLENWSSAGLGLASAPSEGGEPGGAAARSRGLDAPSAEPVAGAAGR